MDRLVLESKLESLRRCVERVHQRCPATVDALANDLDAQDVVVLNLSRAVVFSIAKDHLDDFRSFAKAMLHPAL